MNLVIKPSQRPYSFGGGIRITQIDNFHHVKKCIFNDDISVRSLGAMIFDVRKATRSQDMIVGSRFDGPIKVWFAPLIILHIYLLNKKFI